MSEDNTSTCFPIGIQCMELNVVDVDESVRDFVGKTGQVYAPSWKYPTMSLHAVQVHQIIQLLQSRGISQERHYLHLLELLHDRLYYGMLAFLKFLVHMIQSVEPEDHDKHSTGIQLLDSPFYGTESKSSSLISDKPHCSVGLVFRQFRTKLLQLDACFKDQIITTPKLLSSKSSRRNLGQPNGPSARNRWPSRISASVQTDECYGQSCDTCRIAQEALKTTGDIMEECFNTCGCQNSLLAKTKRELRQQIFWISQHNSVVRWCDALKHDCTEISTCAARFMEQNLELENRIKTISSQVESKAQDHKFDIKQIEVKLIDLEHEIANERNLKSEMKRRKDLSDLRCAELEEKLRCNYEALSREVQERSNLEMGLATTGKAYRELKKSYEDLNAQAHSSHVELNKIAQEKSSLLQTVAHLQQELQFKEQELLNIRNTNCIVDALRSDNAMLRSTNDALQKKADTLCQVIKDDKVMIKKHKSEINRLEKMLEKSTSDMESLLAFPDLNGPIQPPEFDPSDILGSMEGQLRANQLRVELLTDQNERLQKTIVKLRDHLQHQQANSQTSQSEIIKQSTSLAS